MSIRCWICSAMQSLSQGFGGPVCDDEICRQTDRDYWNWVLASDIVRIRIVRKDWKDGF